jgi:hypothetical protein
MHGSQAVRKSTVNRAWKRALGKSHLLDLTESLEIARLDHGDFLWIYSDNAMN